MYNGIKKIEEVINYIEENILNEPDYAKMASIMNLSMYEFRRIFSFFVGCPLAEYIRKRKLSIAAVEIMQQENIDLEKISEKYGYSNQSAFSRAFSELHNISPSACIKGEGKINLFTCPKFSFNVEGRETIPFKIIKTETFYIKGFSAYSKITDTCCCEDVWNSFYESGADKSVMGDKILACYFNEGSNVLCTIGEAGESGTKIQSCKWACFEMNTVDDDVVNDVYTKIIFNWLPSAGLKKSENNPVLEIYPADMSSESFIWEIRIPIE